MPIENKFTATRTFVLATSQLSEVRLWKISRCSKHVYLLHLGRGIASFNFLQGWPILSFGSATKEVFQKKPQNLTQNEPKKKCIFQNSQTLYLGSIVCLLQLPIRQSVILLRNRFSNTFLTFFKKYLHVMFKILPEITFWLDCIMLHFTA